MQKGFQGHGGRFRMLFLAALLVLVFVNLTSMAQEMPPAPQPQQQEQQEGPPAPAATNESDINPNDMAPVVFSYWEHAAINDARNSRGEVRPPTAEELAHDLNAGPGTEKPKPPPEEREIRLGGIVYVNGKDWSIWLNEKRVTPGAIPPEVMDLKVYKDYVEIKWFDEYTNQIFPLRLRAHERFNIDTRIFLPG